jgi:hypothetical protein
MTEPVRDPQPAPQPAPRVRDPQTTPRVRDRDVVLAAALVVAGVLIVAWLTGFIPALDSAIGLAPVVIVALVVVTVVVLARALWPRRPGANS